jgi:hypothetical protein
MPSVRIGSTEQHTVDRIESGIYLFQLRGHLTMANAADLRALAARDSASGPRATLYETTDEFTGYDPALRGMDPKVLLDGTHHIGIITRSALSRMVSAAIAVGLRATMGIPMVTYSNLESAVEGARDALSKVSRKSER